MRRTTLVLAVLLAAGASSAGAQTAVVAKRRAAIPAPAPPPTPAPAAPAAAASPARLSLTGLPSSGDGGATCRSTCARTRYACEVQEESCGSQWASCLKTCSDAAAIPATALLPR